MTALKKYVIECSDSEHADNEVDLDAHYRYTDELETFPSLSIFAIRNP